MKAPRRCGRIAGSVPFNLPQGTGARLFAAGALAALCVSASPYGCNGWPEAGDLAAY